MNTPSEPVRIALIGLKGINLGLYLPAVLETPEAKLVAGVDPAPDAHKLFAEKCPAVPLYERFSDMLGKHPLDAVVIGTPNPVHLANIREAAEAGLHASVTKPLCNTVAECREAIAVCRKHKVLLQVGHEYRFGTAMKRLLTMVHDGEIGELSLAIAHMGHQGGLSSMTQEGMWRSRSANVPGGCLNLLGVHYFDLMNAIFGKPVSVVASVKRLVTKAELDDTAATIIEYENGCVATVTSSYVSSGCAFIRVFGTKANLWADTSAVIREDKQGQTPMQLPPRKRGGTEVIQQFCRAIREGASLDTPGEAGMLAVAILEAALKSQREGRRVMISEVLSA